MSSNINQNSIAQIFNQLASEYHHYAFAQQEIGTRLIERLTLIKINPKLILDLGSGTGKCATQLAERYPQATIINCDLSSNMLQTAKQLNTSQTLSYLCANGNSLPLKSHSIDFVFSNCALPWFSELNLLFTEIKRVLKPGGLFLFSSFGPDTLWEFAIDLNPALPPFLDMHIIGDQLVAAMLHDPVMDMDNITLTYPNSKTRADDLEKTGLIHKDSSKTPLNTYPATFEVIYGHAWLSEEQAFTSKAQDGIVHIPIENIQVLP